VLNILKKYTSVETLHFVNYISIVFNTNSRNVYDPKADPAQQLGKPGFGLDGSPTVLPVAWALLTSGGPKNGDSGR
jgi:hypothetical protein